MKICKILKEDSQNKEVLLKKMFKKIRMMLIKY
jgi:hypothetical protein